MYVILYIYIYVNIYIYIYLYIIYIYILYTYHYIYIHHTHIYIYINIIYIYIWSPPHGPPTCCLYCDLQYNMLIFYVHILRLFVHIHTYIFIQTKTQQYSDTLWGGSLAENKQTHWTNKTYVETLWGGLLGENQKNKKTNKLKNKTKKTEETKPIGDPAIPMVLFFLFWGGLSIYIYIPPMDNLRCQYPFFESGRLWERAVS